MACSGKIGSRKKNKARDATDMNEKTYRKTTLRGDKKYQAYCKKTPVKIHWKIIKSIIILILEKNTMCIYINYTITIIYYIIIILF